MQIINLYTSSYFLFVDELVTLNLRFGFKLAFNELVLNNFNWIGDSSICAAFSEYTNSDVNLLNSRGIYHYSIPVIKLYYPEPFIALPSLLHYDPWFIHILIYQYWLWFLFIFVIVFFFLTFVSTLRWNSPRFKPRRETRGVSRSKCGDLITATVPTTWAGSIIIHESTDAVDLYDGFGTSELVIGIRAFQWGWEYYYPKDIDLSYNNTKNQSFYFGRSLKYDSSTYLNTTAYNFWRFYQLKSFDKIITPLQILLLNTSNPQFNFINTQASGYDLLDESSAFNRIYTFSNLTYTNLYVPALLSLKSNNTPYLYQNYTNLITQSVVNDRQHSLLGGGGLFSFNLDLNDYKSLKLFSNGILSDAVSTPYLQLLQSNNTLSNEVKNSTAMQKQYYLSKGLVDDEILKRDASVVRTNTINKLVGSLPTKESALNTKLSNIGIGGYQANISGLNSYNGFIISDVNQFIGSNMQQLLFNNTLAPTTNFITSTNPFALTHYVHDINVPYAADSLELLAKDATLFEGALFNLFWDFGTFNSSHLNSFSLYTQFITNTKLLMPVNDLYADYDFKRWQAFEILDELVWESNSGFNDTLNYMDLKKTNNDYIYLLKLNVLNLKKFLYYDKAILKSKTFKYDIIEKPLSKNYNNALMYPFTVESTNSTLVIDKLGRLDMQFFYTESDLLTAFDGSFNSSKSALVANNQYDMAFVNTYWNHKLVLSGLDSLDSFRNVTTSLLFNNPVLGTAPITNLNYYTSQNSAWVQGMPQNLVSSEATNILYSFKNTRNTMDAIQKIFRTKIDEARSHNRLLDYSTSSEIIPLVTDKGINLKGFGGKSLSSFFETSIFIPTIMNNFNFNEQVINTLNTYIYDLPFLLSIKSDAARYIWTDWNSKWSLKETQASSLAKYSMYGMSQFSRNFDFFDQGNSTYKDTEQYMTRLHTSRQNTFNSWQIAPYNLIKLNLGFKHMLYTLNTKHWLQISSLYWTNLTFFNTLNSSFFASNSNSWTSIRNYMHNFKSFSNMQTYTDKLVDVLTKREYLLRQLNEQLTGQILLPVAQTASPYNDIFSDITAALKIQDVLSIHDESNYLSTANWLTNINLGYWNRFLRLITITEVSENNILKSQFKPLKKGISNMVKLHATGAIALPVEMRIQLLASSRDVIHSWAVPSAGVKIDCVPGYSSHRIITFLLSGVYWGQCMEICGRYHHWMPIIVYFMKRDLFLLWCTHFIFFKDTLNIGITDMFTNDSTKTVTFNPSIWV